MHTYKRSGNSTPLFIAVASTDRSKPSLGQYATATEAAVAVAKHRQDPVGFMAALEAAKQERDAELLAEIVQQQGVVSEACGMRLFLSPKNPTGYLGVKTRLAPSDKGTSKYGTFQAHVPSSLTGSVTPRHLGYYPTAMEAAVAIAKFVEDPHSIEQKTAASQP